MTSLLFWAGNLPPDAGALLFVNGGRLEYYLQWSHDCRKWVFIQGLLCEQEWIHEWFIFKRVEFQVFIILDYDSRKKWHINPCRLVKAKSSIYIYIQYIYDFFWLVLRHINDCGLFIAKSSLYIYIKYIWFGMVSFYGIYTIVCYLMSNNVFTYILNIYII